MVAIPVTVVVPAPEGNIVAELARVTCEESAQEEFDFTWESISRENPHPQPELDPEIPF